MTDPGGLEVVLVRLTDRVLDGESVDLEVAVRDHPEHETGIREAWPRILSLVAAFDEPLTDTAGIPVPRGYRPRGPVHKGGQGRIVEVVEEETGSVAAFKVMTGDDRDSVREILAFDRLRGESHPAVVKVLSVSGNGILMELLEGPDLADLVDLDERPGGSALLRLSQHLPGRRTVSREVALAFAELARGLSTLHERGILHRDLKPHNVKVVPDRGLVLFDLGIARVDRLETISDPDTVLGTLPFLSPEAVPGSERSFDERTDVYGLGATLYSILTNRYPHAGKDAIECLVSVRTKAPQPVTSFHPDVPPGLAQITEKAIAREPGDRYDSALELAQDLERFAAGKRALAEISREARRRRKRAVRLGLAAGGVLVVLFALLLWQVVESALESRVRRQEEARAERVAAKLESARRLKASSRIPEALDVVEIALREVRGPTEEYDVASLKASLLNAAGQRKAATAVLAPHLEAGATPEIRRRARTEMARIHADVGRYRESYRLLIDRNEGTTGAGRHILTESVLRLGRTGQARRLLAAAGDEHALAVLDRFRLLSRVSVPGVRTGAAASDGRGRGILVCADLHGRLQTMTGDEWGKAVPLSYRGPPIQHPTVVPTGRTGEVALSGSDESGKGAVAIIDAALRRTVLRWDERRVNARYATGDVDGDGRPDHVLHYQVSHRGIDIFDGEGNALPLGDLDELNHAVADVRNIHFFHVPGDPAPRILVATGPWDQKGLGFSLLTYRWAGTDGFRSEGRLRVGDVTDLATADLDGDGSEEVYVSIYHLATPEMSLVYPDFVDSGIYRVDPVALRVEPVLVEDWQSAYVGRTADLRLVHPHRRAGDLRRIALAGRKDALVFRQGITDPAAEPRTYLRVVTDRGSMTLPTPRLVGARLTVGELDEDAPGPELAVIVSGEVYLFGAGTPKSSGLPRGRAVIALPDGPVPASGWSVRDRRDYRYESEGVRRGVCEVHRGDHLDCGVRYDGSAFRYRVGLTIREMDWAGSLRIGLFGPLRGDQKKGSFICIAFERSSYGARALGIEYSAAESSLVRQNLEVPGSYGLAWGTPLECVVEYSPEPPSLLMTCRNEETGAVLYQVDRALPGPLAPNVYRFGIRAKAYNDDNRATTRFELRRLELLPFGRTTIATEGAPARREPARHALEEAHFALLDGDRDRARREVHRAIATKSDLVPLLVGPFATPSLPLARLVLEEVPPANRAGLRSRLIELAVAGSYWQNDPDLAIGLIEAGGVPEAERKSYAFALLTVGLSPEALRARGQTQRRRVEEPPDVPGRLSLAGAAAANLYPDLGERLIRPILKDPPSVRARVEALIIGVRTAVMEGKGELARERIRALLETPGFEAEQLQDYADLRRFLAGDD